MAKRLILASSSPRRIELLKKIGVEFETVAPEVEEVVHAKDPRAYALTLAKLKAQRVAAQAGSGVVLGADTVVTIDGEILGKPKTEQEAFDMLKLLSGRRHLVITGVVLLDAETGKELSDVCETEVEFRPLTSEELKEYVSSGEPFDKAGGYGIQGLGAILVKGIVGDFYNVVGLPLTRVVELLKCFKP